MVENNRVGVSWLRRRVGQDAPRGCRWRSEAEYVTGQMGDAEAVMPAEEVAKGIANDNAKPFADDTDSKRLCNSAGRDRVTLPVATC